MGLRAGFDVDKALAVADEDAETLRKLALASAVARPSICSSM